MTTQPLISLEPATGNELWRGTVGDVAETTARARRAWPAWAAQPVATRMELVRRFANEVRKVSNEFAELVARETGKPLWEANAEIEAVIAQAEISIRSFAERTAQRRLNSALQGTSALRHKPHGVIAVITPFNLPAQLPASQIIPALIAGNAIIFKPSEKTPASGEYLIQCFNRAGISAAVTQLLIGGAETGLELAMDSQVDGVLFAGSTRAGITINRKLASNPGKLVALELGGNNPIVVWDTPKVTDAAVLVIQSAFASSGQRSTSARRLIIQSSLYDDVIVEVKRLADRLIVGAPLDDPAPFMGPVIDNQSADQMTESFLYLLSHGGKAIKHMTRPQGDLPFLSPAIIDVTNMKERPDAELFGPLLQVVKINDFDQAIAEANNTRFGLAASLIGGTPQEYNRFWANIRAGMVNWNRPTTAHSESSPLGGVGLSGNHRPAGFYTADHCAYPVSSTEMDQPRASVGVGFSEG